MVSRVRNSRGRPKSAPTAFIVPRRPTVASRPPSGPGWAHELKHDGYRLQIHIRDGRVRLYTINGADSLIIEAAVKINGNAMYEIKAPTLRRSKPIVCSRLQSRP